MLFASVTVVVILASGDPGDGSTAALNRALRGALGDRAEIVVGASEDRATPSPSTFVARVEWLEGEKRAVVRTSDGTHSAAREIRFDANDAPSERGRTVGFALASMVPDAPPESPPPAKVPAPVPPPVIAPSPMPAVVPGIREAPPKAVTKKAPRFSLELLGQGATGIRGTAGGLGGAVGGRLVLPHGFNARLAFGLRLGEVPSAQATSRVLLPSIGAGYLYPITDALLVGGRVDFLAIYQYVAHFSADDPEPDGRGRWMPGVDARLEGAFRVTESTALTLGFGPEVAFGTTRIYVAGQETDPIPPLRFCGEVGITVAF